MHKLAIVTTVALGLAPGLALAGQHRKVTIPKLAVVTISQIDTASVPVPTGTSVAVPIPVGTAPPKR
jgi:hypothetical protein